MSSKSVKTKSYSLLVSFLLLAQLLLPASALAVGVPTILSYQGRLTNSSGSLLGGTSGTTYYFKFSIWDAASGGNKLWPSSNPGSVASTVRDGVFNVNIGDTANGYPDALDYAFDRTGIFLKVEVSSDNSSFETLTPRQQISSAAFAQVAGAVVSASSTISNLTSSNATTTNATSTNFYATNATAANVFATFLNAGASAMTTLVVNSSSTLQNFTAQNSTSSNATTTNLFVSGRASTTDLLSNTATLGSLISSAVTISNSLTIASLGGNGTRCLQTDNNGLVSFSAGACGGGSGSASGGSWSTTTSQVAGQFLNYSNNTTDIVAVGGVSTTTASVYFDPNSSFAKIFNQSFSLSSTTLQNFTAQNATTTSLSASILSATGLSNTLVKANASGQLVAATPGTDYLTGMTFAYPFRTLGTGEQSTSTTLNFASGILTSASSTLASTTVTSLLANNATATDLFVSNIASTTQIRANTGIIGFITSLFGSFTNLFVTGSSTLQNFTAQNSTTTNATSTNIYVAGIASTTELRTNGAQIGNLTTGSLNANGSSTLNNFTAQNSTTTNASTTNLAVSGIASVTEIRANTGIIGSLTSILGSFSNLLLSGSSTFQSFTAQNSTTTNATTTSFAVSSISSSLLKAGSSGSLLSAISGTDYQAPITAQYPVLFNSNIISLGFGTTTSNSWSGAQTFLAASTTLQNFTAQTATTTNLITTNSTTTNATTTSLATNTLCIGGDCRTSFPAASTFAYPFVTLGTGEQSTSTTLNLTAGLLTSASSTLASTTVTSLLANNATTTDLYVSRLASTSEIRANTGVIGFLTSAFATFTNAVFNGSTTLQNFTAQNSTTTNSTSTNFYTDNFTVGGQPSFSAGIKTNSIVTGNSGTAALTIGATATPQILTIDTINNRVQAGIGSGSAAPVLVVLDTRNIAGDPDGVNGSMYYNSNSNSFRCYQDSAWQTCGGQATSTYTYTEVATSTTVNANTANIGNLNAGQITSGLINGQTISSAANFTGTLDVLLGLTSLSNLFVSGSTTLQNFTAQNSTSTNATSSTFASNSICLGSDCRTAWPVASAGGFTWPFTKLSTNEQATSTTLALLNGFLSTASSTLTNFTASNSTTTNATTTNLAVSGLASTTELRANTATIGVLNVGSCVGCGASGTFAYPFRTLGTGEQSTSTTLNLTAGLLTSASSTLASTTVTSLLANNATATNLHVSGLASTTNLRSNTGIIGFLTSLFETTTNLLVNGSSTLQNFTASNSTTTNATSTTLATGSLCLNGDCRTSFPAASSFAWPFTKQADNFQATSTGMLFSGGFVSSASSTLSTFTFTNATGTSLSAATIAASGLSNTIVKANAVGQLIAAVSGTDYQAPISATFPILFNSNVLTLGFGTTTANTWSGAQTFTNASTTLQNFTAQNATTTSLSASVLAASGLSNTLVKANAVGQLVPAVAGTDYLSSMTFAFPFTKLGTNELSTSTTLVFGNGFVSSASSTLKNFTAANSTTTNATSTTLATESLCLNGDCRTSFPAASTFSYPFRTLGTGEQSTSTTLNLTAGLLTSASSTLASTTVTSLLANNATATNLYVGNIASTSQIRANTGIIGFLTSLFETTTNLLVTGSSTLQNFTGQTGTLTNLAVNGSSTLQNFTSKDYLALGSTTLQSVYANSATATSLYTTNLLAFGSTTLQNATSSDFFVSGLASTTNLRANVANIGNLTVTSCTGCVGGSTAWDTISDPAGNGAVGMAETIQTLDWHTNLISSQAANFFQFTILNDATTDVNTQTLFTLENKSGSVNVVEALQRITNSSLSSTVTSGLIIDAAGTITNALDVSAAAIGNALTAGANDLTGINWSIIGSSGFGTFGNLLSNGSTTLQSLTATNSTTTNATSTNFATNTLCIGGDCRTSFPAASTFAYPFSTLGTGEQSTSTTLNLTAGLLTSASSTLASTTVTSLLANNATATNLHVSGLASTTNLRSNTGIIGFLTSLFETTTNLLVTGSSTLQNFTASNSTTTNATSTTLATGSLCLNGDCRTSFPAASSFAWPFTKQADNFQATSTGMLFSGGFVSSASSTLSTFTFTNATGTSLSAATIAASGLSNTIVKANAVGQLIAAVSGTDYQAPISATFPILFNSNVLTLGFGTTTANTWSGAQTFTNASTTLQNFTAQNATTTSLSASVLAASGLSNTLVKANAVGQLVPAVAGTDYLSSMTFAFPFTKLGTNELSTSTTLVFGNGFVSSASSTLQNFTASNSTTTNATSTTLATGSLCLNGDCRTSFPAASTFAYPFSTLGTGEQSTSTTLNLTAGLLTSASSTLASTTVTSLLANNATATNLHVSGLASTTNLRSNTGIIGFLTSLFETTTNLLVTGSSTLQNFTASNSTTTNATSTTLATGSLCLNGDCRTSFPAASTFAYPFRTLGTGEQSTSTTLNLTAGLLTSASSTLASTTVTSLLANNATATNLYVGNIASTSQIRANTGIIGFLTSLFETTTNLLVNGSSTLQNFSGQTGTLTNLAVNGSSTLQNFTSKDYLALGSTTLQSVYANSATATRLYATNFLALGSTTLQNATSSDFFVSGLASTTNLRANVANIGNLTVTNCTGCGGGASFAYPFRTLATGEQATSTTMNFTGGLLTTASSTLGSTTVTSLLANTATSTYLHAATTTTGKLQVTGSYPNQASAIELWSDPDMTRRAYITSVGMTGQAEGKISFATGNDAIFEIDSGENNAFKFMTDSDYTFFLNGGALGIRDVLRVSSIGNIGIGSSTPNAKLSVHAAYNELNTTLFDVASSTAVATTSLFSISNAGLTKMLNATATDIKANTANIGNLTVTSCTGCGGGGASFAYPFRTLATGEQATSTTMNFTGGILTSASSTLASTTVTRLLSNSATTTSLAVTGNAYINSIKSLLAGNSISIKPYSDLATTGGNVTIAGGDSMTIPGDVTISGGQMLDVGAGGNVSIMPGDDGASVVGGVIIDGVFGNTGYVAIGTTSMRTINIGNSDYSTTRIFGTTTIDKLSVASSTLASTTIATLLANRATSTNLYISNLASSTNLHANVANIGNLTVTSCTGCGGGPGGGGISWPWTKLETGEQATSTTLAFLNGILTTASSTFNSSVIVLGSTTMQALYSSSATATNLYANNLLMSGSTTLQNFSGRMGTLHAQSDPSAPATDTLNIYSKLVSGKMVLKIKGPSGLDTPIQNAFWQNNITMWNPSTSTAGVWLGTIGAGTGTYTTALPTTVSLYTSMKRARWANVVTTTNQILGQRNTEAMYFLGSTAGQGGFFFYTRMGFDVWTTGARFFAGMHLNTTVVSGNPSAVNNTVGFAVDSTDAGAISFLSRGTAATKASTGFTISSGKGYDLYMFAAPGTTTVSWRIVDINTGSEASGVATANMPAANTMLSAGVLASNAAVITATSVQLGLNRIYIETDY